MLKNFICVIIYCLITSDVAQAQLPPPPLAPGLQQWFKGWYVNQTGDTLNGYIFLSNQIDNQFEFRYSTDVQHRNETTINAGMARCFRVKDRLYESIFMEIDRIATPRFFRCVDIGYLHLYVYCSIPPNAVMNDGWTTRQIMGNDEKFHEVEWVIRKGNDAPVILPSGKKFIELMTQYTSDNKQISLMIEQKEKGYRLTDLAAITEEYNKWKVNQ